MRNLLGYGLFFCGTVEVGSGLFRSDTGKPLAGSGGQHIYLAVQDGADVERFLKTLHLRCWLAGMGWMMLGAGGQLLERSIVDRVVGSPERLVFEGAPVLEPPLAQDQSSRQPVVTDGEILDTVAACPPLSILELAKLRELRARETERLAPETAKARKAFIAQQAERLSRRTGLAATAAARVIERQCAGILRPDVALPFDDEDLAGANRTGILTGDAGIVGRKTRQDRTVLARAPAWCHRRYSRWSLARRSTDASPRGRAHGARWRSSKHRATAVDRSDGQNRLQLGLLDERLTSPA